MTERDLKDDVKAKFDPLIRAWKTVAFMVREMSHALTAFNEVHRVHLGKTKMMKIAPIVEECMYHRQGYIVRMHHVKMDWWRFEAVTSDMQKDFGTQFMQIKGPPVGQEKEVLDKVAIRQGLIVIA